MGRLGTRRGVVTVSIVASFGFVIGAVAFGVTAGYYRVAKNVPMIHDITTDPTDPPTFVALLPERKAALNGAEYGGAEVAAAQRKAYPDIVPIESVLSPPDAFDRALAVARGMDWKIVEASPEDGRIEATDKTRWLLIKDDVVIRVTAGDGGRSRIDVRSVSRLGKSDLGKNAERIREFTKRVAG